jgi:AmmeMemoRadiSam system protein B
MDSNPTRTDFPKLRNIDVSPVLQDGQAYLLLSDPLQLFGKQLLVPHIYGHLLQLCDGTRDAGMIRAGYSLRSGRTLPLDQVKAFIAELDRAFLLENDRSHEAEADALAAYRAEGVRKACLAGVSYPEDARELQAMLDGFTEGTDQENRIEHVRGLISPHIDYARGGRGYAAVWGASKAAIYDARLAVILGTDHYGQNDLFTLTRADYVTPFGSLPTEVGSIDRLAVALGEAAFRGELRHSSEHSIELAAIWFQYMRGDNPCPIIPVLCGSINDFFQSGSGPMGDPLVSGFIQTVREIISDHDVIVIAAGDLSHVGPAFGGPPVSASSAQELAGREAELIRFITRGDPEGFFNAIGANDDRTNICGLAPIYHALQILGPLQGDLLAYEHCAADREGTSIVSIAGVAFYPP